MPFAPVFSNLFEVLYICVMCVAPAVAFATGGATLSALTGLPYLLCNNADKPIYEQITSQVKAIPTKSRLSM